MLEILYQDPWLVAVNKPAGWLVHRSWLDRDEKVVVMQTVRDQIGQHVFTAHRLDRPTSGVLLMGLSSEAGRRLAQQFEQHHIRKRYHAIVRGWLMDDAVLDYPLVEERDKIADKFAREDKAPQPAVTQYRGLATVEMAVPTGRYPTTRYGLVELVQAGSGTLMILRHTAPLSAADKEKLERFSHSEGLSLFLAPFSEILETVSGEAPWYDSHGLRLAFSPRDFIQVNEAVNQQMVARALEWLDVRAEDRVLDLFCGMGNFTLPLATRAASVIGVEGVPALVEKGRENAIRNGLHNVTFFHENLEEDVTKQPWAKNGFDKVLLDPARAGATGVMRHIIKLKPIRIVYVSCNPATLARDSEALVNAGYEVTRLAMLDMFPHTGHLESMVLFERM